MHVDNSMGTALERAPCKPCVVLRPRWSSPEAESRRQPRALLTLLSPLLPSSQSASQPQHQRLTVLTVPVHTGLLIAHTQVLLHGSKP